MTRVERESIITSEEYDELMQYMHPDTEAVEKIRYCLMYNGRYFEIDVFPFWGDKAYLEIELINEEEDIEIPPFITIIKEVTDDKRYTNKSIAGLLKSNMVDIL
jgi:CYTH domain-containing protein